MSLIVTETKIRIKNIFIEAAIKAMSEGELPQAELTEFNIEVPTDSTHGDFAVNAAMVWARLLKANPRVIAETLLRYAKFGQARPPRKPITSTIPLLHTASMAPWKSSILRNFGGSTVLNYRLLFRK